MPKKEARRKKSTGAISPARAERRKTLRKQGTPRKTDEETAPHTEARKPRPIAAPDDFAPPRSRSFPVVGIGASAGGLDAFQQLFSVLPERTGMAYVVVQHMDPKHASMLTEILSRSARIPVMEARDGTSVKPDRIYVIPPNTNLAILHGTLSLLPRPESRGPHMPVDVFFRSLAQDAKEKAIAVVLSGTANDGALGTRAVKAEGGITFAQDEASAKYPGMPLASVATGCVDFVLPPQGIADELARIGRSPYISPQNPPGAGIRELESEEDINKIFILLRDSTGVDFSLYKAGTIRRRILRRMTLHKIEKMKHYVRHLQEHPPEQDALFHDFLISVTSFFREPEAFQALKATVIPLLIKDRPSSAPIRVWVPGCSTGEEPYSIAICLMEALGERASGIPIQIFATDINEAALETARIGLYSESIAQDVSPERVQRFFVVKDHSYQISKNIRDLCVFARQNLARDPPFSRMDLISCRNVLIYMKPHLHKKLLPVFHYALKATGFLMLGTSESIGEFSDLFGVVSRKQKLYSKKATLVRPRVDFGLPVHEGEKTAVAKRGGEAAAGLDTVQKEVEQILLTRFAPPGVVVNEQMEILQFRGQTGSYLAPAPGTASLNLMKMAREGLAPELRNAIQKARKGDGPVVKDGVRFRRNGEQHDVRIEVVPVKPVMAREPCYLVLFEEPVPQPPPGAGRKGGAKAPEGPAGRRTAHERRIRQLEQELAATKEYLQSLIEEHEATNEELRSANEEIQSANEELNTVNEEMANRNAELAQANDELVNFLESVNIPLVVVGTDLRIRRFTPNAVKAYNLIPADVGRRIDDIKPNISVTDMGAKIREVIESFTVRNDEVTDREGRQYTMRIRPLKTSERKIDGAVISLIDVDEARRTQRRLRDKDEAFRYADAIVQTVREALLVLDAALRVVSANRSFYKTFRTSAKETEGKAVFDLADGKWDSPGLRALLEEIFLKQIELRDYKVEHDFPGIGRRRLLFNARRIERDDGAPQMILLAIAGAGAR